MATAESAAKADSATHADVLIIGAGISGIGSACHLQAAEPHGRTGRDAAQSRSGVTIRITGQRGRRFLPLISRVVSSFMTATGGVNRAPLTAVPGIVWINAHERLHSRESGDRTGGKNMHNRDATVEARRRFITLVGGSALLAPFVGLAGCGGPPRKNPPPTPMTRRPARRERVITGPCPSSVKTIPRPKIWPMFTTRTM